MAQNITLNSYSLQSANIVTSKIDHEGIGIDESQVKIPHRDGEKLVSFTYGIRKITLEGNVIGSSIQDLDSQIDTLKKNVMGVTGNLDIDYNGTTRRYSVHVQNIIITRDFYNLTIVPFRIECEAVNPSFGQDTASTNCYNDTAVSGTFSAGNIITNFSATISGSVNPQPIITFTVNVAGSITGFYLQNTTTNTGLNVIPSAPINNSDVYVIDTSAYTITKNGIPLTTFSGTFPTFNLGTNNFVLNVYGSTPNFTYQIKIDYTKSWL